jgi:hypothetical protein
LVDGGPGPRETTFQRAEGDPNPQRISFLFNRFPEVTPSIGASDHCPVFLDIP